MTESAPATSGPLHHFLHVLSRRRWVVLAAIVVVPLVAVAVSLRQVRLYEASADVLLSHQDLASTLTGTQRILSVPLDSAHGLIGQVEAGDHVDVFIGFNVTRPGSSQAQPMLRRVMQNVPVVNVAAKGRGLGTQNSTTNVSLVVNDRQAGELAFAADNGKVWLALRPAANVKATIPATITINTEMLGLRPLAATPTTAGAYKSAFWTGR